MVAAPSSRKNWVARFTLSGSLRRRAVCPAWSPSPRIRHGIPSSSATANHYKKVECRGCRWPNFSAVAQFRQVLDCLHQLQPLWSGKESRLKLVKALAPPAYATVPLAFAQSVDHAPPRPKPQTARRSPVKASPVFPAAGCTGRPAPVPQTANSGKNVYPTLNRAQMPEINHKSPCTK